MVGQPFGAWLAGELAERGESRRSFARRIGVTDMTVTGWIRGAQPTWENCQRIASALDADAHTVRRLAGYDDDGGAALGLHYEPTAGEWEAIKEFARGLRGAADGAQTGTEDGKRVG